MLPSLPCAASCLPSVQDTDRSRDGFRNDSGLKVALIKCTGDSLTIATQPRAGPQTSSLPPCPVVDGSTTPTAVLLGHIKETANPVVHFTCLQVGAHSFTPKVADLRGTHSTVWRVMNSGDGGLGVYPRSPLLCSTLAGGCVFVLVRLRVELSSCFHDQPGCRGYCQL